MTDDATPTRPMAPEVPDYLLDALDARSPGELREIATYADQLAEYYEHQHDRELEQRRQEQGLDDDEREAFDEQDYSDDPGDNEDVPNSGAYITVKEPKHGKRYFYWQWRSGPDSWENQYIGPVG